jgi:hypothetical protein
VGSGSQWHQQPISSGSKGGRGSASFGRPVVSLERTSAGEHLGQCPKCGSHQWWDNRGRKRSGSFKATAKDYKCKSCSYGFDEGEEREGPIFDAPVSRPPAIPPRQSKQPKVCAAVTSNGAPCKGSPMKGSKFCGPHQPATSSRARTCKGTTKAGKPCQAGAQAGSDYCPQHRPS